jgi:hypothetical protein
MLFAQLAVVFVGIAGNKTEAVEHQLAPVLDHAGVTELAIPTGDLGALARHTDVAKEIVRNLHVDGLIGGALIAAKGKLTFRLVIYDADGNLKSLGETPLVGKKLSKDDLEVLGMNLDDEVAGLTKKHHPEPAPAPAPKPVSPPPVVVKAAPPPPPPVVVTKVAPVTQKPATKTATSAPPSTGLADAFGDDKDAPPGLGTPAAPAPRAETHEAAAPATEVGDAVSLDDIESLTGGNEGPTPIVAQASSTLHLHAGVGLGLAGRVFTAPAAVTSYSSTPVGAVQFAAGLEPTARTALDVTAERTLTMSSPVSNGMAATTMSRWEVTGAYRAVRGAIEISPTIGLGHRSFSIDSTDPSRSPDGDYSYLVLGAAFAKALGTHVALRGLVAFEPVLSGVEPTEMAFGEATRWALDVGAAIELRPIAHIFARAAVDYQRFAWSWDQAGARGAGGATDSYPSGTLSLGAEY